MKYTPVKDRCCQNEKCQDHRKFGRGNIIRMCYYNFVRPHSTLIFGDETRTPAMQTGLVKKQLSFREIFTASAILFWWFFVFMRTRVRVEKFTWISA